MGCGSGSSLRELREAASALHRPLGVSGVEGGVELGKDKREEEAQKLSFHSGSRSGGSFRAGRARGRGRRAEATGMLPSAPRPISRPRRACAERDLRAGGGEGS